MMAHRASATASPGMADSAPDQTASRGGATLAAAANWSMSPGQVSNQSAAMWSRSSAASRLRKWVKVGVPMISAVADTRSGLTTSTWHISEVRVRFACSPRSVSDRKWCGSSSTNTSLPPL